MTDWSSSFLLWLAQHRTPEGLAVFTKLTEFGGGAAVVIVFLIALFYFWRGRRWAHALGLMLALGGSVIVMELLKNLLRFERPDAFLHAVVENGYAFPSGHSTASAAMYGFLAWWVADTAPRWRIPAIIVLGALIVGVGFSRLYLGVHWPADVIGGYSLGFIFVWLGMKVTRRFKKFESADSDLKQ